MHVMKLCTEEFFCGGLESLTWDVSGWVGDVLAGRGGACRPGPVAMPSQPRLGLP